MQFRITDTFTESLAWLTGEEQKVVKTTAFDLQLNPANPGMNLHKLEKAQNKNFWSVRVSNDIRLVETTSRHISISTMHLAKGLEFRAVVVMACDDEILPLQERIETVGDDADLREVYDTEAPSPLRRLHAGARLLACYQCHNRPRNSWMISEREGTARFPFSD